MMSVGQRIKHNSRGCGVIVALNNTLFGEYNKEMYPYIVRFDDGYSDVYRAEAISAI